MTDFQALASVPTESGSRYLQQLCKHWSHNLQVQYDEQKGEVVFPHDIRGSNWASDGKLSMTAQQDHLDLQIDASSEDHLAALKDVVQSHLDRFAFREAPLSYDWKSL